MIEELIGSLMTYKMTCNACEELENHLPENRKDFELRTNKDHSSISSNDGELELITMKFKKFMKQKLKNKNNATTCYERKKKNTNWDESSSSEDEEKINKGEVADYTLTAFDDEVIKIPLIYFEIT